LKNQLGNKKPVRNFAEEEKGTRQIKVPIVKNLLPNNKFIIATVLQMKGLCPKKRGKKKKKN